MGSRASLQRNAGQSAQPQNTTQALIEQFDGTSWKIAVQDPNASYFYGIACISRR